MLKPRPTVGDTKWFVHYSFGLFIHLGVYALGARHEWVMNREEIPVDVYERRYFKHFDPDLYDPELWAAAAAGAGMKYFVVTSKHHDGFCLWDSKHTDYKAPNTPCGRDVLKPMVNAFRKHGLRVGFYHSLLDWHHPHFPIDDRHAQRNHPDRAKWNRTRDVRKYAQYLHNQTRELLTQFGKVDILWYDFSYAKQPLSWKGPGQYAGKGREDWQSEKLIKLVRKLAPKVVLNDRLDLPLDEFPQAGDIKTPEQFQPREWLRVNGVPVVWEACQTFSGSWGYHRDEASWRSVENLVQTLIDCVSKGGNLLLNVGPTGRGEFDQRALDRLAGMGQWMKRHNRAIYGCTQAPEEFKAPQDSRLTYNPDTKRLYIHLFAWPYKHVHLDGEAFCSRVEYAQLLNDASEVPIRGLEDWQKPMAGEARTPCITLTLPQRKPDVTVPVVELFLK